MINKSGVSNEKKFMEKFKNFIIDNGPTLGSKVFKSKELF